MASKHKKDYAVSKTLFLLFAGLALFAAVIAKFLQGKNIALLDSKGMISAQERHLMIVSILIILAIAVPTVFILYLTAWKYRESNTKKTHDPTLETGKFFAVIVWALPAVFIVVLAFLLVPATYKLQPRNSLDLDSQPVKVQVIAMRWKWLFIYPDYKIATINFMQIPKDRPIVFDLTADDAPMSSFWVPNLSGQLYAMTGHVNRLNLMASHEGNYPGRSAEINGAGFEGMKFMTRVSNEDDFEAWVNNVRSYSAPLDSTGYNKLLKPTENNEMSFYTIDDDSIYTQAVMKYAGSHHHSSAEGEEGSE